MCPSSTLLFYTLYVLPSIVILREIRRLRFHHLSYRRGRLVAGRRRRLLLLLLFINLLVPLSASLRLVPAKPV